MADYTQNLRTANLYEYVKILHFMWIDVNNENVTHPPSHVHSYIDEWKKSHSEWELRFWNLKKCKELIRNSKDLGQYFSRIFEEKWYPVSGDGHPFIQMYLSDVCRMAVIYEHGGVYCDLSVKPFSQKERDSNELLGTLDGFWNDYPKVNEAVCYEPVENYMQPGRINKQLVCTSVMASRNSHNPYWKNLIQYILDRKPEHSPKTKFGPITVTGPLIVNEYNQSINHFVLPVYVFARRTYTGAFTKDYNLLTDKCYAEKMWKKSSGWGRGTNTESTTSNVALFLVIAVVLVALFYYLRKK